MPARPHAPVPADPPWQPAWFETAGALAMNAWRGVESQTEVATLRLVDTREEHEVLEDLLEASKPPLPPGSQRLHYLIFTPFRYASPTASRFRRPSDGGVWYGADSVHATCAEIAYWRMRFILDSAGLAKDDAELLTSHTIFRARVAGRAIDLLATPWVEQAARWAHPQDYSATQALAAEARARGIEWIRYASVRHPGGTCAAVLAVSAVAGARPAEMQEWKCRATRQRVIFVNRSQGLTYSWDA